jgi:hypothetical protein
MSLNVSKMKSSSYVEQESLEAGAYPARVVQIIDLGVQAQRAYQGQEKPPKPEVYITYELLDVFMKDKDGNDLEDKPRWISERIPLSSLDADLAKSTKRYLALDPGKEFGGDFTQLINAPCLVTVALNKKDGRVYENVAQVGQMRPKDAAKAPDLKNPPKVFVMDAPDVEVFQSLPEWLQKLIQQGLKYKGSPLDKKLSGGVSKADEAIVVEEDDLPW